MDAAIRAALRDFLDGYAESPVVQLSRTTLLELLDDSDARAAAEERVAWAEQELEAARRDQATLLRQLRAMETIADDGWRRLRELEDWRPIGAEEGRR